MKKKYTLLSIAVSIFVLMGVGTYAQNKTAKTHAGNTVLTNQPVQQYNPKLSKLYPKQFGNHQHIKSPKANTTILSQDFSSATFPPTGWTSQIIAGPMNWVRQTYLTLSYNTLDPTGTTFTNGYACANSDSLGSSGENCVLKSLSINCSSYTNVWLSFNEFFRQYATSTATVEVSTNGTTWTTVYTALPGVTTDSSTANPHFVDLDLTSNAAGQSTFYVRFHWQGNYDYYWIVDDIILYTKPAFDVALTNFSNPNEYVVKPLGQYTSGPLTLAATAKNMGAGTLTNVNMDVKVYNLSNMTLVHLATSNTLSTLASNATGLLTASTAYTPPADTSIYYIEYLVHSAQIDADNSNDTLYSGFWISDSLFARSDEMYTGMMAGSLGFGSGTKGILGNDFTVSVADKLSRIDAYVTGPAIGDTTQMFVYSTDANGKPTTQVGSTAIFKFTAAAGQWVSLPLQGGALTLTPGTYYVGLKEFTATNNIGLAYTDNNYTPHKLWVQIGAGAFDTLETYGYKGSFIIEPYLVCASFMTNITATEDTICSGQPTTLTAINGLSYSWSPGGQTTASIVVNPATTTIYTVTVTNKYGCTDTDNFTVVVNNVIATASATPNPICAGASSQLNASGGTTYMWSPTTGLSNPNISNPVTSPTTTTTYCVTVTNACCTAVSCVTVTVNPNPNVTIIPSSSTICSGSSVILTASGATTYSWSPATGLSSTTIANPTASPTITTTYVVTGTSSGCTATNSVTVTVNAVPTANAGTDQSIPTGTSTTLTGSATGGTPTYTYNWAPAGDLVAANVQNPTTNNLTTTTVFTLTVTDNNGCTGTDQVIVTVTGGTLTANCGAGSMVCYGNPATLNVLPGGGAPSYTYFWNSSPADLTLTGQETLQNPTVTPTVTTTYDVTVTDANTSTATCSMIITVDPPMAIDSTVVPATCGNSDGSATINVTGGTGPYTYFWNTAPPQTTQTATGLLQGTYCVTITDAVGCPGSEIVVVNCIVGIPETSNAGNVSIAPNPSNGTFSLVLQGYNGKNALAYILSIDGKTIFSEKWNITTDIYTRKINLQTLNKGIYFLKLITNDSIRIEKLIIK